MTRQHSQQTETHTQSTVHCRQRQTPCLRYCMQRQRGREATAKQGRKWRATCWPLVRREWIVRAHHKGGFHQSRRTCWVRHAWQEHSILPGDKCSGTYGYRTRLRVTGRCSINQPKGQVVGTRNPCINGIGLVEQSVKTTDYTSRYGKSTTVLADVRTVGTMSWL